MNYYEFREKSGKDLTKEEFRKIELVFMNCTAIATQDQMIKILEAGGMENIDVLYSLIQERGKHIETIGGLRDEIQKLKKENRKLKDFREAMIKAYKEYGK